MMASVKLLVALLLLLLVGCSSPAAQDPAPEPEPERTWLGMVPGDAVPYDGPAGQLVLIYVDETYDVARHQASAITWKLGEDYTTDFFVEEDDGSLWWYGRRGSWRATRRGEGPRPLPVVDDRVTFGDRTITLSDDGAPLQVETPEGVFMR